MSPSKSITKKSAGITAEEKAAMKALVKERKANATKAEAESACVEAIAKMQEPDRSMAKRIHAIIKANAPDLAPTTWYGMPAYANPDGKAVCYFRDRMKFKERYAMFAFNDTAKLDEGSMWPIAYALPELTSKDEERITALLKKAVS